MPWKETCVMEERLKFVTAAIEGGWPFADLCRAHGISRKTGYKFLERYNKYGLEGLRDRSRAPLVQAQATAPEMIDLLLDERRAHPRWGPRKIVRFLERKHPSILEWPAVSTVGEILKRHGLVEKRKRRRRTPPSNATPTLEARAPNHIWCADFKGHFRTRDGSRCDPLTVSDGFSRFLIGCRCVGGQSVGDVLPAFSRLFERYGLPRVIRTDNGPPFASAGLLGLSQLSVWWIKLGITPERIMPGRPDQNGAHGRLHRTLKAETAMPPRDNLRAQQRAFDRFRVEYNTERPHEALEDRTPSDLYRPSAKPFPSREPVVHYPDHFDVKKVRTSGAIRVKRHDVHISHALIGEPIGLEQASPRHLRLHFCHVPIGIYDLESEKLLRFALIPED